ncbi:hypothetical protein CRE_21719 [Caenorhabditis remanei]|uniref:Uncharacterized protein n=1 Tax=Caenorhabditis remanei TaxID=31234 RepID=E3MEG1_CAERE|nr:hypothetical protein CRE_21719 [Caenorhabditis remanei]
MERKIVSFSELLSDEQRFFSVGMPNSTHRSEDVIGNDCCEKQCTYFFRRIDVLLARHHYMKCFDSMKNAGVRESRFLFINSIKRIYDDSCIVTSLNFNQYACPSLISRVFGCSIHVFLNAVSNSTIHNFKSRPWYKTTSESISDAMYTLSKCVEFNSLDSLMVPPNFQSRITDNSSLRIPITQLRKRMDIKIRARNNDTLMRCTPCCILPEQIKLLKTVEDRKEAEKIYQLHLRAISQQRAIIQCLNKQSRDDDADSIVLFADAMSNKHSKLPCLVNRPKCISDADRLSVTLTTVQVALNYNFINHLKSIPSIGDVTTNPTVFDFDQLGEFMNRPPGICSNGQITLTKDREGKIFISSGGSINSSLLFGADSDQVATHLFKREFYISQFTPTIRIPEGESIRKKIASLLAAGGSLFNQKNQDSYWKTLTEFGEKSIRLVFSLVNSKPDKVALPHDLPQQDPHVTVLEYLTKNGFKAGRLPRDPTSTDS